MQALAPCSSSSASAQSCWWNCGRRVYGGRRNARGANRWIVRSEITSSSDSKFTLNGNSNYATRVLEWATGGALDFRGATDPLIRTPLAAGKRIFIVRHGLSSWNDEGRIQGSSDLSTLTDQGVLQAQKCRHALSKLKFDKCYASPISRAKSSAEVMWSDRKEPLIFLDSLREAHLLFLEGMKNEDAKQQFPELFKAWREDPSSFNVNGEYPVVNLWGRAREAWAEMLEAPGDLVLVVTHKSILRALICTALGLKPERFRSIDIHNSGISSFTVNKRGEPMLDGLNLTAHLHADDVYY